MCPLSAAGGATTNHNTLRPTVNHASQCWQCKLARSSSTHAKHTQHNPFQSNPQERMRASWHMCAVYCTPPTPAHCPPLPTALMSNALFNTSNHLVLYTPHLYNCTPAHCLSQQPAAAPHEACTCCPACSMAPAFTGLCSTCYCATGLMSKKLGCTRLWLRVKREIMSRAAAGWSMGTMWPCVGGRGSK